MPWLLSTDAPAPLHPSRPFPPLPARQPAPTGLGILAPGVWRQRIAVLHQLQQKLLWACLGAPGSKHSLAGRPTGSPLRRPTQGWLELCPCGWPFASRPACATCLPAPSCAAAARLPGSLPAPQLSGACCIKRNWKGEGGCSPSSCQPPTIHRRRVHPPPAISTRQPPPPAPPTPTRPIHRRLGVRVGRC